MAMHGNSWLHGSTDGNVLRIVPQVQREIARVEADRLPLHTTFGLLRNLHSVKGREDTCQEQWPKQYITTSTTSYNATATSIVVADGTFIAPDTVFNNPATGETALVTNVSGNTLTVVRGGTLGGLTGTIASGQSLIFMSQALEEGQDKTTTKHRAPGMFSYYIQKFFGAAAITDVAQGLEYYGVDEFMRVNDEMIRDFNRDHEKQYLFSERPIKYTGGTYPRWITAGLMYWCKLYNEWNMGGGATWAKFDLLMRYLKQKGSYSVWNLVAGPKVCSAISRWALDGGLTVNTTPKESTYGFLIDTIRAGGVQLDVLEHYMLDGTDLDDVAFLFPSDVIKLATTKGEPTGLERDVQTPGAQRKEWQLTDTRGMYCTMPAATAFIYNWQYSA